MKNKIFALASKTDVLKSLAVFLFIALFVFLGMYRLQPPKAVTVSDPSTGFSSGRAMKHIEIIAQKPHPVGSPEQERVREYILSEFTALGLSPEEQEVTELFRSRDSDQLSTWVVEGTAKNIVVRLNGTNNSRAVLIAGHYDSVYTSPNASDGGTSVAVALEVARALKAGPPLKNDTIFLLTTSEEMYLLGAKGFVNQHPWAKDVGVVLHFVARGTSGPSIMFETSPENGWLIEEFAKSAPHPIANSLTYEVYQLLPNDTDFTQYKEDGLAGLNFAYIDNPAYYHTMLDNPENLDERSLQHQGSQALTLARHFGGLDLANIKRKNAVYFDLWGLTVLHYPETSAGPLALSVTLVYVGIIVLGLKRRQLAFSGIGLGVLAFLLTLISALVIAILLERVILELHNEYQSMPYGYLYNSRIYLASFASLTIAVTSALYSLFRKKIQVQNLAAGGLFAWLILTLATSFFLPGASYLFTWPLLFSLAALGFAFISKSQEPTSWRHLIVFSLCAIPGLVLFVPTTYLIYVALPPLTMGGLAVVVLVALLLGSLIPHLAFMAKPKVWPLPAAATAVGIACIVAGSLTASFNLERPELASVSYASIIDTEGVQKAFWFSPTNSGEWVSQFFPNGARHGYDPFMEAYIDPNTGIDLFVGPAPVVSVPMPNVTVLDDEVSDGVRKLHLGFSASQSFRTLGATVPIESNTILSARVNGAEIEFEPNDKFLSFSMSSFPFQSERYIDFYLETKSSQPIEVGAVGIISGLPQTPDLPFSPRPAHIIPSPKDIPDATLVQKSFEFPIPGTEK